MPHEGELRYFQLSKVLTMDSSFIVVAKTVMENRQMIAAMIFAMSKTNPEMYAHYESKLQELRKEHEKEFEKMDSVLDRLNKAAGESEQPGN